MSFLSTERQAPVDLLWELRAAADSRIEPLAVSERRWREDRASPILEIARREGQEIVATAVVVRSLAPARALGEAAGVEAKAVEQFVPALGQAG